MIPETRPTDGEVRDRAFHLWKRRDQPHGHADEFWLQAERELHAEMTGRPVLPDGDFVKSGSGSECCC
ncbi:DUF2934 domain-containing protein [Methylobacterium sp. CM6246]